MSGKRKSGVTSMPWRHPFPTGFACVRPLEAWLLIFFFCFVGVELRYIPLKCLVLFVFA